MKKSFEYITIAAKLQVDLHILCTDTIILDWIDKEIGVKFRQTPYPSENKSERRFIEMGYKQWYCAWWLVQQLCHQGWEPLNAVYQASDDVAPLTSHLVVYQLRKETLLDDE
jgi:hypothetical protein